MSPKVLVIGAKGLAGIRVVEHLTASGVVVQTWPTHCSIVECDIPTADVIVNCAGRIPSRSKSHSDSDVWYANAILPYQLTKKTGRLIHISTDCVFDGVMDTVTEIGSYRGYYGDLAAPTSNTLYGLSKALGELLVTDSAPSALVLRCSIIGHHPIQKDGLLEWFLAQTGDVPAYTQALWTGLTTNELSRIVYSMLENDLAGLYNVSGPVISKSSLLGLIRDCYGTTQRLIPMPTGRDKSLNSEMFWSQTGLPRPMYPGMLDEMHEDYVTSK